MIRSIPKLVVMQFMFTNIERYNVLVLPTSYLALITRFVISLITCNRNYILKTDSN